MMEDIDGTNYVEYQTAPSLAWHPCLFGAEIIDNMVKSQFTNYMERMQKSDCKAEIKRLLDAGPPVWVSDKHGLPLPDGETHVVQLWHMADDRETSAMLEGAVDGEARTKLWDELKSIHATAEAADAAEAAEKAEEAGS